MVKLAGRPNTEAAIPSRSKGHARNRQEQEHTRSQDHRVGGRARSLWRSALTLGGADVRRFCAAERGRMARLECWDHGLLKQGSGPACRLWPEDPATM
eukprot:11004747-Alexandrium_andersonii.AAC.1